MTVVEEITTARPDTDTDDAPTINDRIGGALGRAGGSYERLIGERICAALGVAPSFSGRLIEVAPLSSGAEAWLRETAAGDLHADHASEILALLTIGATN